MFPFPGFRFGYLFLTHTHIPLTVRAQIGARGQPVEAKKMPQFQHIPTKAVNRCRLNKLLLVPLGVELHLPPSGHQLVVRGVLVG